MPQPLACGLRVFLCGHALTHRFPGAERMAWTLTTVRVDVVRLEEPDFEVVEDCRLMQVAQGCQVILSHQDIWIAQERQLISLEINRIFVELKRRAQGTREHRKQQLL